MRDGRRGGVLPKGCVVQRRVPLVVPQVDVGVCLQQGLHHLQVPLVRGNLQGSPALVLGIDLWEGQRHRKLGMTLSCAWSRVGTAQKSHRVRALLAPLLNQQLPADLVPKHFGRGRGQHV